MSTQHGTLEASISAFLVSVNTLLQLKYFHHSPRYQTCTSILYQSQWLDIFNLNIIIQTLVADHTSVISLDSNKNLFSYHLHIHIGPLFNTDSEGSAVVVVDNIVVMVEVMA
jgi:hypothetical protein